MILVSKIIEPGRTVKNVFLAAACGFGLSACATNYAYTPIIPNPPNLEMTQARCEMMSASAEQGMFAIGTPSYVAGAQLGHAIDNAIRVDQFMGQCMTMNGWRRTPVKSQAGKPQTSQMKYSPLTGKPMKGNGAFPPAPGSKCPTSYPKPVSKMTQLEKAKYGVNTPGCPI